METSMILAWVAILALGVSVIDLVLGGRKDHKMLQKMQTDIDAQRQAIAVLGTIAKTHKKSVKIQESQFNLDAGIALLKALGILDKDGKLVIDLST